MNFCRAIVWKYSLVYSHVNKICKKVQTRNVCMVLRLLIAVDYNLKYDRELSTFNVKRDCLQQYIAFHEL